MLLTNFINLFFAMVTMLFFMGVGRFAVNYFGNNKSYESPFYYAISGISIWYFCFLIFNVTFGFSLVSSFVLYAVIAVVLLFISSKTKPLPKLPEHFYSFVIIGTIFLLPVLWWAASDVPTTMLEFDYIIKNASHIFNLGSIYNSADITKFAIKTIENPVAYSITLMPVHFLNGYFTPFVFAFFNIALLLLMTQVMAENSGIKIKWSNLPLVVAGALIGVSFLNPFFSPSNIMQGVGNIVFAVVLFAALLPILDHNKLPKGLKLLPTALTLALLMGLKLEAIYYYVIIVFLWMLKNCIEEDNLSSKDFFGWTILITIPAISWLLWALYLNGLQTVTLPELQPISVSELSAFLTNLSKQISSHYFAVILTFLFSLSIFVQFKRLAKKGMHKIFITDSALTYGSLFCLIYMCFVIVFYVGGYGHILGSAKHTFWLNVSSLQFVVLLPIWIVAMKKYQNSWMQKLSFKAPWGLGLMLAAALLSGQIIYKSKFIENNKSAVVHTLNVSEDIKAHYLPAGARIGVIDSIKTNNFYTKVMAYGLNNYNETVPLTKAFYNSHDNFDDFYGTLLLNKIDMIWVHIPTKQTEKLFGKKMNATSSYLLKVVEDGVELIKIYPHPAYTTP